ncbi:MAG: 5-formyltetrahydrofolate cyclo-ligase [Gammaproteobacteria bacterium]|nr:5-formyltetrahydrofolate cyclo-ligase [Gammaproteobacteria bacterium]
MMRNPLSHAPSGSHATGEHGADAAEKTRLRREIRARRLALPATAACASARCAIRRLWALPALARARTLAIYLPIGGELDCTPLALEAWNRGRSVFLPVIRGTALRFAPFHPESELRPNHFGIPEPVTPARHLRTARQLDVIVAPLVAFDVQGHRLGMGGGYYDRTLAFRGARTHARRPSFIGLAFEMQKVSALPAGAWDIGLDAVITETATYRFA